MNRKNLITLITLILIIIPIFLPVSFSFATTEDVYVDAPVALLMDSASGKILYERNAREKRFPASTTKIMTAILALENRKLTDTATVSENAVSTIPYSYTIANLQIGEVLTYEQLLLVLMLPSANDAATVIAEDIGGSVEGFASMMNQKAREIGCENTNFVNANGIHHENHYTTAYDLALIGQYAMKNEPFRKIVSSVKYTLPTTEKYDKEDRIFTNNNRLINSNSSNYYQYATGIKTGYTDPARKLYCG
ncbi:MAG: D-alanyl-D-alanine carboxypeptidase [Clostridia bacterium]|nr:D-alanyl-D-alanine carboxypeptidase [Clostridia bacterium]